MVTRVFVVLCKSHSPTPHCTGPKSASLLCFSVLTEYRLPPHLFLSFYLSPIFHFSFFIINYNYYLFPSFYRLSYNKEIITNSSPFSISSLHLWRVSDEPFIISCSNKFKYGDNLCSNSKDIILAYGFLVKEQIFVKKDRKRCQFVCVYVFLVIWVY